MSNVISIVILICWFFGSFLSNTRVAVDDLPFTDEFGYGRQMAKITDAKLDKVTGIAASRKNKGFLWALNGHGDGPDFFLWIPSVMWPGRFI